MVLLDTDVVSALRGRSSPQLSAWLAGLRSELGLAAVTVTELQYGISRIESGRPDFAAALTAWLDQVVNTSYVVPLGTAAARLLGRMQSIGPLRRLGARKQRFGADLAIAATAIAAGMPLATFNGSDFRAIAAQFSALALLEPPKSR